MLLLLSHFSHAQLFKTLWPVLPGSSVQGILQAGILKWVAMHSSRGSRPRDQTHSSYVSCIGSQILYTGINQASLEAQLVKNCLQCRRPWFHSWVGKMPWRRAWQLTPVLLPGESPWTKEPSRLQSMGLQGFGQN